MMYFRTQEELMNIDKLTIDEKKTWETPKLTQVGSVTTLVLGGGGKLSIIADDQGDIRKPRGLE